MHSLKQTPSAAGKARQVLPSWPYSAKDDALMIDAFGYVKQDRDGMEVLFTLLAYRYERGSMLLTSNLPFSKWEVIFKDPMTTAAARLRRACVRAHSRSAADPSDPGLPPSRIG
jgi:IstB-like ATP binding protein